MFTLKIVFVMIVNSAPVIFGQAEGKDQYATADECKAAFEVAIAEETPTLTKIAEDLGGKYTGARWQCAKPAGEAI